MENGLMCPICGLPADGGLARLDTYTVAICSACGSWFCRPGDREIPNYDDVYSTAEYQEVQAHSLEQMGDPRDFLSHLTYRPFFKRFNLATGRSLLDIGCGVGRFCRAAQSVGWNVTGIDVSASAIAIGSKTAEFPMRNATLEETAMLDQRFDLVTAFEVLEHLREPSTFVRLATSLLNSGGSFFCTVPNVVSIAVRTATRPDWLPPIHVQFFSQRGIEALLHRSGLRDVRSGVIFDRGWPRHPLRAIRHLANRIMGQERPDPVGLWATGIRANAGAQP